MVVIEVFRCNTGVTFIHRKKKDMLTRRKKVIDLLKKKAYRYSELVSEAKISESTIDRILGELKFLGLAHKRVDHAWEWYLYKTDYSPMNLELAIKHSKDIVFRRIKDYPGIMYAGPYQLLMSHDEQALQQNYSEFAGHMKTGYPTLCSLFERWRELPRCSKVTLVGEDEEPSEAELDAVEDILQQVARELNVIVTKVRNGIPLEGRCYACPHISLAIKE